MNIEIFTICDAATDNMGKLNVLGTFDNINSKTTPIKHPQCAIALRIRFYAIERGEHKLRVDFVNEDGKSIMPSVESKFKINFQDEQRSGSANLIVNIQQLEFPKFGTYSINLAIDNKSEASLPLNVKQLK